MKMCPKVWPKLALSGHQIYTAFQEAGKGLKWYILQFFLLESDPEDSNEQMSIIKYKFCKNFFSIARI